MSDNISNKSSFKKSVSKVFSIFKKNVSKDNNDKGKGVIRDEIGKNDILFLQKLIWQLDDWRWIFLNFS